VARFFFFLENMRRLTLRFLLSAIALTVCGILIAFVISNSGGVLHEIKAQSVECDCPTTPKAVPIVTVAASTSKHAVSASRSCVEVKNTSAVQRAIIIFYPHHQSEYFFPEVRW
jgi:hypothetical protein